VAVLSSLMAIVLQALAARLGWAGLDLRSLPLNSRATAVALWLIAEAAILATDLAEIIGTAIGLQLLFGLRSRRHRDHALDTFLVLASSARVFARSSSSSSLCWD